MPRRKAIIYVSVIALALIALAIDRMAGSGVTEPAPASAESEGSFIGALGGAAANVDQENKSEIPAIPFPRIPESALTSSALPDLFAPPAELSAESMQAQVTAHQEAPKSGQDILNEFAASHTVSAIFAVGDNARALINGKWYKQSAKIDDCVVANINGDSVLLECVDGMIVLHTVHKPVIIRKDEH